MTLSDQIELEQRLALSLGWAGLDDNPSRAFTAGDVAGRLMCARRRKLRGGGSNSLVRKLST